MLLNIYKVHMPHDSSFDFSKVHYCKMCHEAKLGQSVSKWESTSPPLPLLSLSPPTALVSLSFPPSSSFSSSSPCLSPPTLLFPSLSSFSSLLPSFFYSVTDFTYKNIYYIWYILYIIYTTLINNNLWI